MLRFVRHPQYSEAHPGEHGPDGPCLRCAIAADEAGNEYLLWQSNDAMWALSRSDPRYGTDQYVEVGDFDLPDDDGNSLRPPLARNRRKIENADDRRQYDRRGVALLSMRAAGAA